MFNFIFAFREGNFITANYKSVSTKMWSEEAGIADVTSDEHDIHETGRKTAEHANNVYPWYYGTIYTGGIMSARL